MGFHAARYLTEAGATCLGVAEVEANLYNKNGIDPVALDEHRRQTSSLAGFPGAQTYQGENMLCEKCDILVAAACERVITAKVAHKIQVGESIHDGGGREEEEVAHKIQVGESNHDGGGREEEEVAHKIQVGESNHDGGGREEEEVAHKIQVGESNHDGGGREGGGGGAQDTGR